MKSYSDSLGLLAADFRCNFFNWSRRSRDKRRNVSNRWYLWI